jgi:hypothetical protein
MSTTDLPDGYRWATAEETEAYGMNPAAFPAMVVVVRTADASGVPYTQGEADLALPAGRLVPDLTMEVVGEFGGDAYPRQYEYEVRLAHDPADGVQMLVTDSGGAPIAQPLVLDDATIDGIISMSSIDHDLSGYEDDWTLPVGMQRVLTWMLQTDMDHTVELDASQIDQIAEWLTYATGEKTWNWDEQGEEWVF